MSTLSIWAIQRDNGGCPGATGANDCSGIAQSDLGLQPPARAFYSTMDLTRGWSLTSVSDHP